MGCVYKATNRVNGKKYVGMTTRPLSLRKKDHRSEAVRGGKLRTFYAAIRKYGFDAFDWEVIFTSNDPKKLFKAEAITVVDEDSRVPNGYNMSDGGEGQINPSAATRRKMSLSHLGKKRSDTTKQRLRDYFTGRPSTRVNFRHTEESKKRIGAVGRGRRLSTEVKVKIGASRRGKTWEEIYGEDVAAEMRARRSAARKGKTIEEIYGVEKAVVARQKMSAANVGRTPTEETRKKLSESAKTRRITPAVVDGRAKQSAAFARKRELKQLGLGV